ncbi:MAG: right-handed parallel beta-helix repeat-containing protein [Planctomycetota bacterium]
MEAVRLDGFLIADGYADSVTTNPLTASGAGILAGVVGVVPELKLYNLTIRSCQANETGGGLYAQQVWNLQMHSCMVTDNRAGRSSPIAGSGGGIYLRRCGRDGDNVAIHNVQLSRNEAPAGSALHLEAFDGGRFSLVNSLINSNLATDGGGAVLLDRGSLGSPLTSSIRMSHCTVVANNGGGIQIVDASSTTGVLFDTDVRSSISFFNRLVIGGGGVG